MNVYPLSSSKRTCIGSVSWDPQGFFLMVYRYPETNKLKLLVCSWLTYISNVFSIKSSRIFKQLNEFSLKTFNDMNVIMALNINAKQAYALDPVFVDSIIDKFGKNVIDGIVQDELDEEIALNYENGILRSISCTSGDLITQEYSPSMPITYMDLVRYRAFLRSARNKRVEKES